MSAITIKDLPVSQALDRKAMTSIRGAGGAPWVFAFKALPEQPFSGAGQSIQNLYQVTNNYFAQQMVNKSQTISINNTGDGASINAVMVSAIASV